MLFIAIAHLLAISSCELPRADGQPAERPGERLSPRTAGRSRRRVAALLAATGVALGCALQCKYAMALTTLAWLGLQNVHTLGRCLAERRGAAATLREAAVRGSLLLGIPVAMHLGLLRLHLW